jgi:hypothetical protein
MRARAKLWMGIAIVMLVAAAGILVGSANGNGRGISAANALGNAAAQQGDPNAITVTVTITGKGNSTPPAVPKEDVVVRQSGKVRPVISWEPAKSGARGLDLVILIDDELPFHVTTRWDDFRDFVNSLPANVHVGVAYARGGAVQFTQQPTLNHETAAKAFRDPANLELRTQALYRSVQALAAEWPANQNRHVILLLSSGLDTSSSSADPAQSISVQAAVTDVQGKGITVYAFYANPSTTPQDVTVTTAQWGQGALESLTTSTGGKLFTFSDGTPQSFAPWLTEVGQLLGQEYSLTFQAQPLGKAGFAPIEVKVENSAVQVHAPSRVFVPGGK